MEDIEFFLDEANEMMDNSVTHTARELGKIRAGKATPAMLDGIMVPYYGSETPLNQVSSINTPDARTIMIRPWEKNILHDIEVAIINSDLGLNPQNDGEQIILNIPILTEERRQDLMKQVRHECELGKVSVRNARKEVLHQLKQLQKDGVSEDAVKRAEDKVQELTDKHTKSIDELLEKKEEDIMKV